MNKGNLRNVLKFFVGWPVTIISFFFIFKLVNPNWPLIGNYLVKANYPILFLAFLSFLGYFFIRGYVWQLILKFQGYIIPFKDVLFFWEISEFKRYIPGNIWSFVSRGVSFSEKQVKKSDIVKSLILEAELVILASLLVSILSLDLLLDPLWIGYKDLIKYSTVFGIGALSLAFIFSPKIKINKKFFSFINLNLSPGNLFTLLAYSFLSFFLFGLATFLTGYAFFGFNLSKILVLSGFFTFSLLVGYLSFIAPMGLGVREGAVVFGLTQLVGTSIAGLIAIFTRIFLIFSEIIFLLITSFFYYLKSKKIQQIGSFLTKNKYGVILGSSVLIYFLFFSTASLLRYENYFTGRFDLGNMDQVVWNSSQGRYFQLTDPNGTEIVSRLAFHADFILVLFAPLYYVWSDPRILLIFQSLVVSLGAVFVYLIAKEVLKSKNLSLVLSFSYLINPALNYANLYDFHSVTLVTTFLLASFYFILKKKYILFTLFAILAGMTKENIWLIVSLLGLYVFFSEMKNKTERYKKYFGLVLFFAGIFIFYILIWKAIPLAKGGNHFALEYYSEFGSSPSSIVSNIIFSPYKTISSIFGPDQNLYLFQLLSPLGFLSILAPLFLIFALPELGISLLSNNVQLHQIYYQYSSAITPFIFISSIYGVKYIYKIFPRVSERVLLIYLVSFSLYAAFMFGPLPGAKNPNIAMFTNNLINKNSIDNFLKTIPSQYSVAATNNLGSHLSQRERIYTIPVGIDKADVIVFLLNDPYAQPSLKAQIEMAENMEKNNNFIRIFKDNDFVVFVKKNLSP